MRGEDLPADEYILRREIKDTRFYSKNKMPAVLYGYARRSSAYEIRRVNSGRMAGAFRIMRFRFDFLFHSRGCVSDLRVIVGVCFLQIVDAFERLVKCNPVMM